MTRRAPDRVSGDLFSAIAQSVDLQSPAMDLKVRISHAMGAAMKACPFDRYEIAARMSRTLGRDVTKNMLDAYAAPSKDGHVPNLAFCIAFDEATGQRELLRLYAALLGWRALAGEDALLGDIIELELQELALRKRKRRLKEELLIWRRK